MCDLLFGEIDNAICETHKKRSPLIKKLMGNRVIDALLFMPSYTVSKKFKFPITRGDVNSIIITKFTPLVVEKASYRSKKPFRIDGLSGEMMVSVLFFNTRAAYFKYCMKIGNEVAICGKLTESINSSLQFIHPENVGNISKISEWEGEYNVYPLTAGITTYGVVSVIKKSIQIMNRCKIEEWIPREVLIENNWPSFREAISRIHNPELKNDTTLKNVYLQRLCFDECLCEHLAKKISNEKKINGGYVIEIKKNLYQKLIDKLPFKLTDEQLRVVSEIEDDMSSGKCMARLLQGDVGSGKTIVALISALLVIDNGYQVALLAPTEILARQHYETFQRMLDGVGVSVSLLTSFEKGKKRAGILENLANGSLNLIVGTHSIISDTVIFNKLGMVIIDEQHRFGVNQRLNLINKGGSPHVLSMTATPIPRTLLLSIHGDINVSTIKLKPLGRREIITRALPISRIIEVVEAMKHAVTKGEKIYWVCPLIEESEVLDYTCVNNRYAFLQQHFGSDVLMMHGKMKSDERNSVFESFKNGEAHILVSTTIIEVGVDIPDATIIIIENAEKFGLSQLHQLRGRVGRGDLQSFCILMYENRINTLQRERIKVIKDSNDGFYIADKDLILRGSGDALGTRQSGAKKYKTFDINDAENQEVIYKIMRQANEVSQTISIEKCLPPLKMFLEENFENIKHSF